MTSIGPLFIPFWQRFTSFGKVLLAAMAMLAIGIGTYVAVFISDEIHAHGDPWLITTTEALVTSPVTRAYLNTSLRLASQHPLGFFLLATFVVIALTATVSAWQIWRAVVHGSLVLPADYNTARFSDVSNVREELRQTVAPAPSPIVELKEPNIICARTTVRQIPDPTNNTKESLAILATFHNSPLPERLVGDAENVTASIIYQYDPSTRAEQDERDQKYFASRHSKRRIHIPDIPWRNFAESLTAVWTNDRAWTGNRIDFFGLNAARELILAIRDDDGKFYALEDFSSERDLASRIEKRSLEKLDEIARAKPGDAWIQLRVTLAFNGRKELGSYKFWLGFDQTKAPDCSFRGRSALFD